MLRVIKRDGRIKDFDFNRIQDVIEKAYKSVYGTDIEMDDHVVDFDCLIMELEDIFSNYTNDSMLSVESIQDIIIKSIKKHNPVVAKAYSGYRKLRTDIRESNGQLLSSVRKIIDYTNKEVLTENSNKQSQLQSTQRDLIAGEVSKVIARHQIPEHVMDAHNEGIIKIHDLDYYMQGIYNCELVNLKDMLQNGTVINKKKIHKPKSLRTAMTLATQIAAQVSSSSYGGQTMSLSHLAPFVRISEDKIRTKYNNSKIMFSNNDDREEFIQEELKSEIRDSVQTFNYQISTIMTTNGQAPFISLAMYLNEEPEYVKETSMLIEEFLRQRIDGMENENGVVATQTFPKLLYFLDENNTYQGSEYFWLTELAAKSSALRMNPDYISVKKMNEIYGHAFPPMGCRAFLSPFKDASGEWIFYGRGNLGVQTINLPLVALKSGGNMQSFKNELNKALDICKSMCELRYDKLKGIKASSAPILWQHGAISRLDSDDYITKAIDERGFTVTIGYSGIYETVKYLTGQSHTEPEGFNMAKAIMVYLEDKCEEFKKELPHLRFALYGTPQESTTGWFHDKIKDQFGVIENITDKGWITNSYHVDIRENIDAFMKLDIESELQKHSKGGAVSYVETYNMSKNIPAVLQLVQYMYETIIYAEVNFESDICGSCHYTGAMTLNRDTFEWECPNCGNHDQESLSVVRRTCGYLGETEWTDARKLDIVNRVKHL